MNSLRFSIFKKHIFVDKIIGVLVLGVFIKLSNSGYVPFEDCGSAYHLENIEVADCTSYPCRFAIGSTVTVTTHLTIQGKRNFNYDVIQRVYFVVSKILLEVQVFPDPCTSIRSKSNNTSCNVTIGQRIAYEANITVKNFPPLPATLFWTISDEATKERIVCYKTTVILTNE